VLKITITETPTETRCILQGRLFGPWVSELRATWKKVSRTRNGRACIVDLNDVTLIDRDGEKLLRAMSKEGAHFLANNLYTKHVLEELKMRGWCGLSGIVASFLTALLLSVIVSGLSARTGSEVRGKGTKHDARTRVNSSNVAHATYSPTPQFRGEEDQDYASRLYRQER